MQTCAQGQCPSGDRFATPPFCDRENAFRVGQRGDGEGGGEKRKRERERDNNDTRLVSIPKIVSDLDIVRDLDGAQKVRRVKERVSLWR